MKLYFIPFTKLVLALFPEGKIKLPRYKAFKNLGIWTVYIGRIMLVNDYRKLYEYHEDIKRIVEANNQKEGSNESI